VLSVVYQNVLMAFIRSLKKKLNPRYLKKTKKFPYVDNRILEGNFVCFDRNSPTFQGNRLPLYHSAMHTKKKPGSIPVGWFIQIPHRNNRV
jgi:hypothetical protein